MPKTKVIFPHKVSVNLGDIHLGVINDYMERFERDQSTAIRELLLHGINYVYYIGDREAASEKKKNSNATTEQNHFPIENDGAHGGNGGK
jgi:hypothetical protein